MRVLRQFSSFAVVGAAGFGVDCGLFILLTHSCCDYATHWARTISVVSSITATWILNRQITFSKQRSDNRRAEYFRYALSQLGGLALNIGTFVLLLRLLPTSYGHTLISLTLGAGGALSVNFWTARTFAFRTGRSRVGIAPHQEEAI